MPTLKSLMAQWRRNCGATCIAALMAAAQPAEAVAQEMAAAMPTQASGLLNRFVAGQSDRPGWLYYGVNGADRGLGYRGSYMTVGGYVPYAEDQLGGLWAGDIRSHLSVYGGFFSNVGVVRKQLVGGTLLSVGVFWDYDGDQNQYADTTITDMSGSYIFAGGQTYQQVGVSGEWLTDWGNLRSNGYIPVGSTADTMGPFVGNSLLAINGVNAALGGTDLEIGAYVPGLTDWAGMISVGGYAYGNTGYQFPSGADAVPWFGGVYTRLDMTFINNWDFSLQYNNDSYFDSTGFARLTYRLGGSRRRNVPDQMEQPMMRNEHIVRAHQAPVQALNPANGNQPWRIIHIDNSTQVSSSGNGTAEHPFTTLLDGRDAATLPYDVVFLHAGISNQTPYSIPVPPSNPLYNPSPIAQSYFFNADNQFLVGEGSSLRLNTVSHGPIALSTAGNVGFYPVISNAAGTAIVLTDAAGTVTNATVDHVQIRDSQVGISDGPAGIRTNGLASVNDVQIYGTGPSQRGVEVTAPGSGRTTVNLTNMDLRNLTRDGIVVSPAATSTGEPQVNITNSKILNTGGSAIVAQNLVAASRVRVESTVIDTSTGPGVFVDDGQLTLYKSSVSNAGLAGISAIDSSTVQVVQSIFNAVDIGIQGTSSAGQLNITINDNVITQTSQGNAIVLSTPDPQNGGTVLANVVGNKITTPSDEQIVLFDGNPGGGGPGTANLSLKAASRANLQRINADATVLEAFPNNPTPAVPPPPNYNPALAVPLPPQ